LQKLGTLSIPAATKDSFLRHALMKATYLAAIGLAMIGWLCLITWVIRSLLF
jgi:hypothetical protein